jgi:hypothetical protein
MILSIVGRVHEMNRRRAITTGLSTLTLCKCSRLAWSGVRRGAAAPFLDLSYPNTGS